jgi:hypothetical protein
MAALPQLPDTLEKVAAAESGHNLPPALQKGTEVGFPTGP